MSFTINKLKQCELVDLTDTQSVILTHLVSYILRNNLENKYLPSDLVITGDFQVTPKKCIPVEEKYPNELNLLNKVLALYAMSDKGD